MNGLQIPFGARSACQNHCLVCNHATRSPLQNGCGRGISAFVTLRCFLQRLVCSRCSQFQCVAVFQARTFGLPIFWPPAKSGCVDNVKSRTRHIRYYRNMSCSHILVSGSRSVRSVSSTLWCARLCASCICNLLGPRVVLAKTALKQCIA